MIAWLVVGCLALYLVIGYLVARWQLRVTWARVRKEGTYHFLSPEEQDRHERDELQAKVRRRFVRNIPIWPWVASVSLVTSNLNKVVDRGDPVREAKRLAEELTQRDRSLAERNRRIKELERELGIEADRR